MHIWEQVRAIALGFPLAAEDFPWGESVIKIDYPPLRDAAGLLRGPMFVWLGRPDAPVLTASVKLGSSYDHAVTVAAATPTTMSGLGHWGWLTVPLVDIDLDLMGDWIDESYRMVAPKNLVAALDRTST